MNQHNLGLLRSSTEPVCDAHTSDPFFPEPILRATAEGIPTATMALITGAKHGAFDERKRLHDSHVLSFLTEPQAVGAD